MPQVTNFQSCQGFLGSTSTKQRLKCLAQVHHTEPSVRLEPETPQPQWSIQPMFHFTPQTKQVSQLIASAVS